MAKITLKSKDMEGACRMTYGKLYDVKEYDGTGYLICPDKPTTTLHAYHPFWHVHQDNVEVLEEEPPDQIQTDMFFCVGDHVKCIYPTSMSKTSYGTTYVVQDYSRMAGEIQIINDEGKLWWAFHTRFKLEGVSSPSSTEGWDVP